MGALDPLRVDHYENFPVASWVLPARYRDPVRLVYAFARQADDFAEQAFRAIEAGTSYRVIPWQMGVIAKIMRLMPNALFDRAVQGRARKKRSGE